MKPLSTDDHREFPQALVHRAWAALCDRLQDPVRETADRRGIRTVEVLGVVRYLVLPTARRVHFAYGTGNGRFATGGMRECVSLDPVLTGDLWLAYFAANWLVSRGHVPLLSSRGAAEGGDFCALVHRIRRTPAFRKLLERARACRIEGPLRDRVAHALALDSRIVRWACLGLPRGELAQVDSRQYSAIWSRAEALAQLEAESPNLVRPYAGAALAGALGNHAEPARDLKLALRGAGIGDAGWKLLVAAPPRHLDLLLACTRNGNVFDVYCWALGASLAAEGLLPSPVLQRLAMPYGREPGRAVEVDHDLLQAGFWQPFLRALGRRLASVNAAGKMRKFLDTEFEDVYDWLEWEGPEIDANQARAGWPWMLRQHRAWQERERERALAGRAELRWEVPVPTLEHGSWRVVALRDSYDLWEEGHAMRHCARTYANVCRNGRFIVISIRDGSGARVATGSVENKSGLWVMASVRVFANRPADPRLVAVAQAYAQACNAAAARDAAYVIRKRRSALKRHGPGCRPPGPDITYRAVISGPAP